MEFRIIRHIWEHSVSAADYPVQMAVMSISSRPFRVIYPLAALALAALTSAPARADFFSDLRRTVQTDIPHFFQHDLPCAFGSRTSCKASSAHPAKHPKGKALPSEGAGSSQGAGGKAPAKDAPSDPGIEQDLIPVPASSESK